MKIVTIVGARPQFIKASAVSRALKSYSDMNEILIHTGQHYDESLSDIFFKELDIPRPDYQLNIGSGSHGAQTGRMIEGIEAALLREKPDWILVYGDTNSTLAGAIAASKIHVPLAHIEAGLRSFNRKMPEEINRLLTDHAADLLFAPTQSALKHLHKEGISQEKTYLVGDVMYDVALFYACKAESHSKCLEELNIRPKDYILSTIHRAENTDNSARLTTIIKGLLDAAKQIEIVLPLHPRTRGALNREGLLDIASAHLKLIEPVGYLDMIVLQKNASLIATDSGGVQKEAFFFQVPCITLREETEWTELVELGWNKLVPPLDPEMITQALISNHQQANLSITELNQPYGDGKTAFKVSEILRQFFP